MSLESAILHVNSYVEHFLIQCDSFSATLFWDTNSPQTFKIDSGHTLYLDSVQLPILCDKAVEQVRSINNTGLFIICGIDLGTGKRDPQLVHIPTDTLKPQIILTINGAEISAKLGRPQIIKDFDITSDGIIYLAVSWAQSSIVKLDRSGNVDTFFSNVCLLAESGNKEPRITTLCNGQVVASCSPYPSVKVLSHDLKPLDLIPVQCGKNTFNFKSLSVSGENQVVSDDSNILLIDTDTWKQISKPISFASVKSYMRPDNIVVGSSENSTGIRMYELDQNFQKLNRKQNEWLAHLSGQYNPDFIKLTGIGRANRPEQIYAAISTGEFLYIVVHDHNMCYLRKYEFL